MLIKNFLSILVFCLFAILIGSKELAAGHPELIHKAVKNQLPNEEGFAAGTLVKTPHGYVQIDALQPKYQVATYSFSEGFQKHSFISAVCKQHVCTYIHISYKHKSEYGVLQTAVDQKFYISSVEKWVTAQDLCNSPSLQEQFDCEIVEIKQINEELDVYKLSIEENHNFYVGNETILAHNFAIELTIAFEIGEAIVWTVSVLKPTLQLIGALSVAVLAKRAHSKQRPRQPGIPPMLTAPPEMLPPIDNPAQSQLPPHDPEKPPQEPDEISEKIRQAIEEGIKYATTERKIDHIFNKPMHNLAPLVSKFGCYENVVREVLIASYEVVHQSGKFEDISIQVAEYTVNIRGFVDDGVIKLETFFIPN